MKLLDFSSSDAGIIVSSRILKELEKRNTELINLWKKQDENKVDMPIHLVAELNGIKKYIGIVGFKFLDKGNYFCCDSSNLLELNRVMYKNVCKKFNIESLEGLEFNVLIAYCESESKVIEYMDLEEYYMNNITIKSMNRS